MNTTETRTRLRKAVDRLIAEGKLKSDAELDTIFKRSKGTISTYINSKPGKAFQKNFEEHFKIKLNEFEESLNNNSSDVSYDKIKVEDRQGIYLTQAQLVELIKAVNQKGINEQEIMEIIKKVLEESTKKMLEHIDKIITKKIDELKEEKENEAASC